MKALVYVAPFAMEIRDLDVPEPAPGDVIIRVATAGICGSDLLGFRGKSRIRVPPMVMGHEFTGTVEALGTSVKHLTAGERVLVQPVVGCGSCVLCRGGRANICPDRRMLGAHLPGAFAEFVRAPAGAVYPLPDDLGDVEGTLVEPLSNALHVLGLGGQQSLLAGTVVVLGAGALGILTACMARLSGASRVIVTDVNEFRLGVARRLGADCVLDARDPETTRKILDITGGGARLIIDAAGYTFSRQQAIAVAAPGSTVVLLGLGEPVSELSMIDVINREIALRGSYSCTDEEFRRAIAILAEDKVDTSGWIEMASLTEGQHWFERLTAAAGDPIKVVFRLP